ncbi:MAG: phosphopentomutase, partial [Pseudomonadota bacterium]
MKRAIVIVLDSFGVGATDDADQFGDVGANTYRSLLESRHAH